jgi:hypothetical protein
MKQLFLYLFIVIEFYANQITSNDTYKIHKNHYYNIIYTNEFKNEAQFIKSNIDDFLKYNNKSFNYKFDEVINIILVSNNMQITNGFSTQIPHNMGVYYSGGSSSLDYFTTSSWLKTLFVHEMIHNYQINAKKSQISKTLHKYFGNNSFPIFATLIPLSTIVNQSLPSSILEGNAVLNESLYNIGGRLHNAEFNALKNVLILNNKINPTTFINNTAIFPYETKNYIVGGFYMEYLLGLYGLEKVNSFFYENSIHSINPYLLNQTYLKHFGISFENSINNFLNFTKEKYKKFSELKKSKHSISSQEKIILNKINNKIYFISNNLQNSKEIHNYYINSKVYTKKDTTLNNAKLFYINSKLYSSSSSFINPNMFKNGLFDENNKILQNTQGKAIQDIYNNKFAYINTRKSFLNSKLYIDNDFYTNISSNAMFDDNGNIYYFKQNNKKRELYKNKKLLCSLDTYYAKLVDIYDGYIYFIAHSQNGSSLYKFKNNTIKKATSYDNITDAKILSNQKIFVVTVNQDSYNTNIIENQNIKSLIYNYDLNEHQINYKFNDTNKYINSQDYNEFKELKFSSLYPSYGYSSYEGNILNLNSYFSDPLNFNSLLFNSYISSKKQYINMAYINKRYINIYLAYYFSKEKNSLNTIQTNNIFNASLSKNIYKRERQSINSTISYYMNSNIKKKKPIIFDLHHKYQLKFTKANLDHFSHATTLLYKKDRKDTTYGANVVLNKHIFNNFYLNVQAKYLSSNNETTFDSRGIKIITNKILSPIDKTNTLIEGMNYNFYVKKLSKFSFGLSKSFNKSLYFYTFPISIHNESLFYQKNQFKVKTNNNYTITENIIGSKLDLLFAHNLNIPLTIKYIKNNFVKDDYKVNISLGMQF